MDDSKIFILLVIGLLLVLSIAMVVPFIQYFLLALLLAYIFMPVQNRLEERFSPKLAAGLIVLAATVVVVVPLVFIVQLAVREAVSLVESIRDGEITLDELETRIENVGGVEVDLMEQLQTAAEEVEVDALVGFVDTVTHVLIGLGLTIFLLYYFLKDGDKFRAWLQSTVPLTDDVQTRIYEKSDQIMKAVLVGHILVAVIQGVLAGLGLVVTGVPNATLWTIVMVVLSLLPLVGSFLVWGPATIYLFMEGQVLLAVFLGVWGLVVVGVSDDYLRPIIVDRYAEINPSLIIIGVLGGIYAFGIMGLFFGPVIIGLLRATLDVFSEEFRPDTPDEGTTADTPDEGTTTDSANQVSE